MSFSQIQSLDTRHLGRRILCFDAIDSTNSHALSLTHDPGNDGLVLLAAEQTAGRGQYGRKWTAPPSSSVLLSVLVYPPEELRRPALLTAWAAVSVCETILAVSGLQAAIKWPNDVLVQGKKICGILAEQRTTGRPEQPLATVVGIGLNVTQPAQFFREAELPDGASLASLSQTTAFDTWAVAERLIHRLDHEYDRLKHGDTQTLESQWRERLRLLGKQVVAELAQERHRGRLLEVGWDGLVLATDPNNLVRLAPERVRRLREEVRPSD